MLFIKIIFFLNILIAYFFLSNSTLLAENDFIKIRQFYNKDLSFSKNAQKLNGNEVKVFGFMAPPLKAEANFFVLTKMPMSVCPFCESEADWPDDILLVYTKTTITPLPFNVPIITIGTLDIGTKTDTETGFVSKIRMLESEYIEYESH